MTQGTGMMDQKDIDLLSEKTYYTIKKPRMLLQIDVSGEEGKSSGDYFRYKDPNNGEVTSYLVQQDFTLVNSYHMKPQAINLPKYTSCNLWFACVLYISLCILSKHDKPNLNLAVTVAWEFSRQRLSFLERAEFLSLMINGTFTLNGICNV